MRLKNRNLISRTYCSFVFARTAGEDVRECDKYMIFALISLKHVTQRLPIRIMYDVKFLKPYDYIAAHIHF